MTRRLQWAVAAVTVVVAFLGWRAFKSRLEANSEQLVSDLLETEAATYTRPVHRNPARDGSVSECVETLVPLFLPYGRTLELAVWTENRALCLGNLDPAKLSEASRRREAAFKPLRPKVADCLREARIAPGKISRFSEGKDDASAAVMAMDAQMGLSNCSAIIEQIEQGNPSAALAECADGFAWFRDAAFMGGGNRLGDARTVGLPVLVPCGQAIDVASNEERAVFARELKAIRAGLPTTRQMADRQRLRLSLWTYGPHLSPAARAKAAPILAASGHSGESYETLIEELSIQANWSSTERVLREAMAEVEKTRSPERDKRLLELSRSLLKNREAFSTITQITGEAEAREVVDSALALLIAAAEVDLDNPNPPPSAGGFSAEVSQKGIGFRLLAPEPTPVIVMRTKRPEVHATPTADQ